MNSLKLAENIVTFRHRKKVTQEELAEFVGVTKASVSKWENRQSMPDIMLLPQLAAFFDVTIDELMGYEPQLSQEQIQKMYYDLAKAFAKEPFESVLQRCKTLIKEYYSCYPFLFQMCCLLLNHYMMAEGQEKQAQILMEVAGICIHILEHCQDMDLCYDVKLFKATVDLLLGKPDDVTDNLEGVLRQCRMAVQSEAVLLQAYLMKQDINQAKYHAQINMYSHLMSLIANATQYLDVCVDDLALCEEVIRRIEAVGEIFSFDSLHPNCAALFYYHAAAMYCTHQRTDEAICMLERYTDAVLILLQTEEIKLHGDSFFTCVEDWFEQSDLGGKAPRDKKLIWDSALEVFVHPVFSMLNGMERFEILKRRLKRRIEGGRKDG